VVFIGILSNRKSGNIGFIGLMRHIYDPPKSPLSRGTFCWLSPVERGKFFIFICSPLKKGGGEDLKLYLID
jgi:hypothetical protein